MARIGELDLPERLAPAMPVWATQIAMGVACAVAAVVLRVALDMIATAGAPFALVYPAVICATMFARWRAGLVAAVLAVGWSWSWGYPVAYRPGLATLVPIVLGTGLTIVIAEWFRAAARHATDERDREIAERDLFLAEFEHRVKNNFAIVSGLLDMQRRRTGDAATAEALGAAVARVDSIARAHRHLYRASADATMVEMHAYLGDLCAALADSLLLRRDVTLACAADDAAIPRDRAVSIGLVINELVTNAAKHAFTGRDAGTIHVTFRAALHGWTVTVADDGIGMAAAAPPRADGGLGTRLLDAFARQAGGTIATDSDRTGTRVTLHLSR